MPRGRDSEKPRNQTPGFAPIGFIVRAERLANRTLLDANFPQVHTDAKSETHERMNLPGDDYGSDKHAQHGGVHGVAQEPVRAGANQLVFRGDGDGSAPESAEMLPGPIIERHGSRLDAQAGDYQRKRGLDDPVGQTRNRDEEQQNREQEQIFMHAARLRGFGALSRRRVLYRDAPIRYEEKPENAG